MENDNKIYTNSALALEQLLKSASHGEEKDLRDFLKYLLAATISVPDRQQAQKLSDQAEYPNNFITFLGIKDSDRNIIPIFSDPDFISSWCGNLLKFSNINFKEVISRMPENWWLVLNPGQEFEKEFSPWELNCLLKGADGIEDIIADHCLDSENTPIEVRLVTDQEYQECKLTLIELAKTQPLIEKLSMLTEVTVSEDQREQYTLLIGAETSSDLDMEQEDQLRLKIRELVQQKCALDKVALRIHIFNSNKTADVSKELLLSLFAASKPFYVRD